MISVSDPIKSLSTGDATLGSSVLAVEHSPLPVQAAGRWKTADAYAMRRIVPIKDDEGLTTAFRPTIQQGRGSQRQTYSEVFRITSVVNETMAIAMAKRWRDMKEAELGISAGQISSKSATRFVPGISLVVPTEAPYRACWRWSAPGHSKISKYIGKRVGYADAYLHLVKKICQILKCDTPIEIDIPLPSPDQYSRLLALGIGDVPACLVP